MAKTKPKRILRTGLQRLAELRLKESKALLDAGLPSGAFYLAGYAVECALKACIAKRVARHEFPDKAWVESAWNHDLMKLVGVAELKELEKRKNADSTFKRYWELVAEGSTRWNEGKRYRFIPANVSRDVYTAIADPDHGVLAWIKRNW